MPTEVTGTTDLLSCAVVFGLKNCHSVGFIFCILWFLQVGFMFFILWFLQVGFGIEIKTILDPDLPFPTAVLRCLEGIEESFHAPFWMFDVSSYQYQKSVGSSIKFLRAFAERVIKQRQQALQRGDETPPDILSHLLKEKEQNPEITMEDLVDNFVTLFIAG